MSDPTDEGQGVERLTLSAAAVPVAPLGYDAPRVYQASGGVGVTGLMLVLGAGIALSVLSAVVAWLWYYLRLPSFYVLPMIAQGAVLGGLLGLLIQRARVRNVPLAVGIGILCGMGAAASFQGVLYVRAVYDLPNGLGRMLEDRYGIVRHTPESDRALARVRAAPFGSYDQLVLIPSVGRGGFRGFLKAGSSEHWMFAIGQAAVVAGLAGWIAKEFAGKPYCETCQRWYGSARLAAVVPAHLADPLALGVKQDDPAQVLGVLRLSPRDVRGDRAISEVYRCGGCGEQLADVSVRTFGRKGQAKTKRLLPLHRVSAETAMALKSEGEAVVAEETDLRSDGAGDGPALSE